MCNGGAAASMSHIIACTILRDLCLFLHKIGGCASIYGKPMCCGASLDRAKSTPESSQAIQHHPMQGPPQREHV